MTVSRYDDMPGAREIEARLARLLDARRALLPAGGRVGRWYGAYDTMATRGEVRGAHAFTVTPAGVVEPGADYTASDALIYLAYLAGVGNATAWQRLAAYTDAAARKTRPMLDAAVNDLRETLARDLAPPYRAEKMVELDVYYLERDARDAKRRRQKRA